MEAIETFVLAYCQLLLLSINSRLTNREQYGGLVVINIIASTLYCLMFRHLTQHIDEIPVMIAYVLGTTLGVLSGVRLHQKWSKK